MRFSRWRRFAVAAAILCGTGLAPATAQAAPPLVHFEDVNGNGLRDPEDRDITLDIKAGLVESMFNLHFQKGAGPVRVPAGSSLTVVADGNITTEVEFMAQSGKLAIGTTQPGTVVKIGRSLHAQEIVLESAGLLELATGVQLHAKLNLMAYGQDVKGGDRLRLLSKNAGGYAYVCAWDSLTLGRDCILNSIGDLAIQTVDGDIAIGPNAKLSCLRKADVSSPDGWGLGGEVWIWNEGPGSIELGAKSQVSAKSRIAIYRGGDSDAEGGIAFGAGSRLDALDQITIGNKKGWDKATIMMADLQIYTGEIFAVWGADVVMDRTVCRFEKNATCVRYQNWGVPGCSWSEVGTKWIDFGADDEIISGM